MVPGASSSAAEGSHGMEQRCHPCASRRVCADDPSSVHTSASWSLKGLSAAGRLAMVDTIQGPRIQVATDEREC